MDIVISPRLDKPIYEQIYEQIVSQVITQKLPCDYCLPSIRTLAVELNISVITIKKAWELLEQKGFIYTVSGKGCFVKGLQSHHIDDKKRTLALERIKNNLPYYKSLGLSKEELIKLIEEEF